MDDTKLKDTLISLFDLDQTIKVRTISDLETLFKTKM
jgi:hypothetical protein